MHPPGVGVRKAHYVVLQDLKGLLEHSVNWLFVFNSICPQSRAAIVLYVSFESVTSLSCSLYQ